MYMLLERRIAGCVIGNVVGSTQSFVCIERNLGGLAIRLASRWPRILLQVIRSLLVLQRLDRVFLIWEQQFRQSLTAQNVEDKPGEHERCDARRHIENAAESLPSCSLWVKKYLFIGHRRS